MKYEAEVVLEGLVDWRSREVAEATEELETEQWS